MASGLTTIQKPDKLWVNHDERQAMYEVTDISGRIYQIEAKSAKVNEITVSFWSDYDGMGRNVAVFTLRNIVGFEAR